MTGNCGSKLPGRRRGGAAAATLLLSALAVSAQEVSPPEVFAHVELARAEVERIRFLMGKPLNQQAPIQIDGAAPREVFFQATTLFELADQLCFEHTRSRAPAPLLPGHDLHPTDVLVVIKASLGRLQCVARELGLEPLTEVPAPDPLMRPTDVFVSIVQAARQINLLLEQRVSSSDVFQTVTLGVKYADALLASFPDTLRIPDEPPFEAGKTPADVYARLLRGYGLVREVAVRSGFEALVIADLDGADIVTEDVFHLASLIVSELSFLHRQVGLSGQLQAYYPGIKFPAHVYQRAGILERQLEQLLAGVAGNPRWLH